MNTCHILWIHDIHTSWISYEYQYPVLNILCIKITNRRGDQGCSCQSSLTAQIVLDLMPRVSVSWSECTGNQQKHSCSTSHRILWIQRSIAFFFKSRVFRSNSKSLSTWDTRDNKMIHDTATSVIALVIPQANNKTVHCQHYCASSFFETCHNPRFSFLWLQ